MKEGQPAVMHVGAYPPPIGGVSEHIRRLDALCRACGIDSAVVDMFGPRGAPIPAGVRLVRPAGSPLVRAISLLREMRRFEGTILHFHLSNLTRFLPLAPMVRRFRGTKRLVATLHGCVLERFQAQPDKAIAGLRLFDRLIVSNESQKRHLVEQCGIDPATILHAPAFLAPPEVPPERRRTLLPASAVQMLEAHAVVAIASGNGVPIYGFHTVVEAAMELPEMGFILVEYRDIDEGYMSVANGLPNLLRVRDLAPDSFQALLASARIFVRPSSEDGDCVALREAVHHGMQIIATSSAPRPGGCLLFGYDDARGLAERLRQAADDARAGVVPERIDSGPAILALYREVARTEP